VCVIRLYFLKFQIKAFSKAFQLFDKSFSQKRFHRFFPFQPIPLSTILAKSDNLLVLNIIVVFLFKIILLVASTAYTPNKQQKNREMDLEGILYFGGINILDEEVYYESENPLTLSDSFGRIEYMKNIVILATGGTIAGASHAPADMVGYHAGIVPIDEIVKNIEPIKTIANITTEQISQIDSADMNHEIWFYLAKRINTLLRQSDVDGIEILQHGVKEFLHHSTIPLTAAGK
jgi:hypothetical protein